MLYFIEWRRVRLGRSRVEAWVHVSRLRLGVAGAIAREVIA